MSRSAAYYGLGFVEGESLAPLEQLTLLNYPWGVASAVSSCYLLSHSVEYTGKGLEMDQWADGFDWSRLRRLTTTDTKFATKTMPRLIALEEVDFQTGPYTADSNRENSRRFYRECPTSLEKIAADGFDRVTLAGVLRHGSTLKKLRLHGLENDQWAENAMDIVSLRAIREGCPLIEELSLDIPRYNDWPWDILIILASFSRLVHLTIWFEVGLKRDRDAVKPYVTFKTVETIYKFLLSSAPLGQQCRVSRFHVYSGAPRQRNRYHCGAQHREISTEFVCTLSERDDEAARNVFEILCPRLLDEDDTSSKAWKVAHDGPVVVD